MVVLAWLGCGPLSVERFTAKFRWRKHTFPSSGDLASVIVVSASLYSRHMGSAMHSSAFKHVVIDETSSSKVSSSGHLSSSQSRHVLQNATSLDCPPLPAWMW